MDEITLTGLRVFGRHGVYEDERRVGQYFVVDFTLFLDTRPAAQSDDVLAHPALVLVDAEAPEDTQARQRDLVHRSSPFQLAATRRASRVAATSCTRTPHAPS